MKKIIYLIRHAKPEFPKGVHLCLGRNTDPGLSDEGRAKTEILRTRLKNEILKAGVLYSSPLKRAKETAVLLADDLVSVETRNDLIEMDFGEWDGLGFSAIRSLYPDLYERRAQDMSILPPGAESFEKASERMRKILSQLANGSEADCIIAVAHSGVNRAFLCDIQEIPFGKNRAVPQAYASVNTLSYNTETNTFECLEAGYEGYVQ